MRYLGFSAAVGLGVGGAQPVSFPSLEGPGAGAVERRMALFVGTGAWGGTGMGADTRSDKSRIYA